MTPNSANRRCAGSMFWVAHAYPPPPGEGKTGELPRRPGEHAAWHRRLLGAALGRQMQADDLRVGEQRLEIRRFEKPLRLGMHFVERFLRQRVVDLAFTARQCGPEDRGGNALAVVLSGTGADGTLGLREIKEAGGITFAQELRTRARSGTL